jgi:hypothetical protein
MTGLARVQPDPGLDPGQGVTPFFPDWVIPLQAEGTERPVFVFPSGHDERAALAIDARIAGHVGRDHPFWGFDRRDSHRELVREQGIAALGAEYVAYVRAIQNTGPYLFYGTCLGGYLAWETARQLLDAGKEIAGVLFFEVPIRSDFANVRPGPIPVHSAHLWRLAHYIQLHPLPVDLTHLMTESWHGTRWWAPWQQLALGSFATVVVPDETEATLPSREERLARHIRAWIEKAESRARAG